MKAISIIVLLLLAGVGCTHPIEIVGEGDIRSSSGSRDCLLEDLPCKTVAVNEYIETYIPQPRSGYSFVGWDNCLSQDGDNCVFNVTAGTVQQNWGKTMPALVAKFAPSCESAPADSFAAIQTAILNGRGCSSGGCHAGGNPAAGLNLASGRSYNSIFNVAAQGGSGLKLILPADAASSYLYRKVSAKTNPGSFTISGSPMPLGRPALSADQLAALAAWIDAGAPQFGRASELNEVERLLGLCD